jgi:hypothetical protein
LVGDKAHHLVRQLSSAAREPAIPRVELQQQRGAGKTRAALPGQQGTLVVKDGPVLKELVKSDTPKSRAVIIPTHTRLHQPPNSPSGRGSGCGGW